MRLRHLAFDAYGTLFDVGAAIARHREAVGPDAESLSTLWRVKQLEYSWTLTLMGRYVDFWTLTARALDFALARHPRVDPGLREKLLDAYLRLEAYPDVRPALQRLRAMGYKLSIFTNGTEAMAAAAAESAGLNGAISQIVSVDAIRRYKTDPAAYAHLARRVGLPKGEIGLVSSNRWDVAGAANAGVAAIWVNRANMPDEYQGLGPSRVVTSLAALPDSIAPALAPEA